MAAESKRASSRRSVREASRAAYREAILDAALRVFGGVGFQAAKMVDIAGEAGVATGTLYNYFSSKEEIFQSIVDKGRERIKAEIGERLQHTDPIERLYEVIRAIFGLLEQHGTLFLIHVQLGHNPNDPRPIDEDDERFREDLLAMLTEALATAGARVRDDIPNETLAWVLAGLIHAVITRWVVEGCQPGLLDQADILMDVFLNGAMSR